MAGCRFCRRPVRWVWTRNQKRMPLDPEPSPDGNVVLRVPPLLMGFGDPVAHVLRAGEEPLEGEERFRHHKLSCPKFAGKS